MKKLLLLVLLTSCKNPTEPVHIEPVCSIMIPNGAICITNCPPSAKQFADDVNLVYTTTNLCK